MKNVFLVAAWMFCLPLFAQEHVPDSTEEERQAVRAQKEADYASAIPLDYGLEHYEPGHYLVDRNKRVLEILTVVYTQYHEEGIPAPAGLEVSEGQVLVDITKQIHLFRLATSFSFLVQELFPDSGVPYQRAFYEPDIARRFKETLLDEGLTAEDLETLRVYCAGENKYYQTMKARGLLARQRIADFTARSRESVQPTEIGEYLLWQDHLVNFELEQWADRALAHLSKRAGKIDISHLIEDARDNVAGSDGYSIGPISRKRINDYVNHLDSLRVRRQQGKEQ